MEEINEIILKSEGNKLINSYSWFKDLDVINDFVRSVDEIADELPEELNILGIGSGVGSLEYAVKSFLEDKYFKKIKLTLSDKYIRDVKTNPGVGIIEIDNKKIPFEDSTFDLIIARSVTHYEKNRECELRVLNEIKRVLKNGGFFITEAPYFSNESETQLMYKIHAMIPKPMNLKTYEELLKIHEDSFDKVVLSKNQPDKPLLIEKRDFVKRYEIDEKTINKVIDLIKQYNPKEIPNIQMSGDNFNWTIRYAILICSKLF